MRYVGEQQPMIKQCGFSKKCGNIVRDLENFTNGKLKFKIERY